MVDSPTPPYPSILPRVGVGGGRLVHHVRNTEFSRRACVFSTQKKRNQKQTQSKKIKPRAKFENFFLVLLVGFFGLWFLVFLCVVFVCSWRFFVFRRFFVFVFFGSCGV